MDANEAVSSVAYKFSELCGIYPITPASPMAEKVDVMSNGDNYNYWGNKVKVVEMQSEAGAVALVHGALQSGILSTTFTASQGLLLMIPTLYKMAGEMLPGVLHVAARSLATHALSIFGDHQDIYAIRQTGVCMLASANPEDAYRMATVAHLSAIKSSLPFVNFFDGFRTSHEIDKIKLLDFDKIGKLIDNNALKKFRERAMSNEKYNLIIEGTLRTAEVPLKTCLDLKQKGYSVELNIIAVKKAISYESTLLRYEVALSEGDTPRATAKAHHDMVADVIVDNLCVIEKSGGLNEKEKVG